MALAEYVQELEAKLAEQQQANSSGHQKARTVDTGNCAYNSLALCLSDPFRSEPFRYAQ